MRRNRDGSGGRYASLSSVLQSVTLGTEYKLWSVAVYCYVPGNSPGIHGACQSLFRYWINKWIHEHGTVWNEQYLWQHIPSYKVSPTITVVEFPWDHLLPELPSGSWSAVGAFRLLLSGGDSSYSRVFIRALDCNLGKERAVNTNSSVRSSEQKEIHQTWYLNTLLYSS